MTKRVTRAPDLAQQLHAFYNSSRGYRDILCDQQAYRLDVASQQYVSLVCSLTDGLVLDLGCGTAETTRQLAARGRSAVGVDISLMFLRAAHDRRVPVVAGDLTRLPFPDHSVGAIGLHNVIEHIPDVEGDLSELVRVLRPDGTI
jgi:ubiquinone/menaquinone biosynthesis C-methylase UbiE